VSVGKQLLSPVQGYPPACASYTVGRAQPIVSGYASQMLTREQSNLEVQIPCSSQLRQAAKYEGATTIMPSQH
jgi:hypothetical protein